MYWMQRTHNLYLIAVQAKSTQAVHRTFPKQDGYLRPVQTSKS